MPEGLTWMEHAKVALDLMPIASNPVQAQGYANTAIVSTLIALVEEIRKTNALLAKLERRMR